MHGTFIINRLRRCSRTVERL